MSIYVGDKKAKLYRGDYCPAQFYKGDVKIAGYTDVEKVGTAISGVDTYNDALNLTIEGKSEQTVTANSPSPDHPEPIRSSENFDVVSCGRDTAIATTAHITDPLRSVGGVSDSIEVSEGKVEVVRRCAQYIADGVIKPIFLQVYTSPECAGFVISAITSIVTTGVCTHAKYSLGIVLSQTTQEEAYTPGGNPPNYTNVYFKIKKSRFSGWQESWTNTQKAEAFKQWLIAQKTAGTPVITQYILYEPTRTDITATPLGQALLAMRTQPHYTQVYTNATLPPTLMAKIKEMVL